MPSTIKEMEFDEMWHFIGSKKTSSGLSKPWIVLQEELWHGCSGRRSAATFQRLYDKVSHLTDCKFYTDDWDAFGKILPSERLIIGKAGTATIEQDNSNTRHHLGRMTRRTKVVSKTEEMVDTTLKLWCALTAPEIFTRFQKLALSSFR